MSDGARASFNIYPHASVHQMTNFVEGCLFKHHLSISPCNSRNLPSLLYDTPLAFRTMATARLRRAFKYPSDPDTDSIPAYIDEQEQDELISDLYAYDSDSTTFYTRLFTALLLLIAFIELVHFVTSPSLRPLLATSSLLATAYVLFAIPLPPASAAPGILDALVLGGEPTPLRRYLVPLNGTLAAVLALGGTVNWTRDAVEGVFAILPLGKAAESGKFKRLTIL